MTIRPVLLFAVPMMFGTLAAQQPARCPTGLASSGDLGIRRVQCTALTASCVINEIDSTGRRRHWFSVEPVVMVVEPSIVEAAVRVGDVLVAIDSLLITTEAGGRRLANLVAGETVAVLVRRQGRLDEMRITAGLGCGVTSLAVRRPGAP